MQAAGDRFLIGGPFGNPDASRTDVIEDYIAIRGASLEISAKGGFHRRVIIGRKGAGKTFFLKTLRLLIEQDQSSWLIHLEANTLTAQFVSELTRDARSNSAPLLERGLLSDIRAEARDFWFHCWEKAILFGTFRLFETNAKSAERKLGTPLGKRLAHFFKDYPFTPSPIAAIKAICDTSNGLSSRQVLNLAIWDELRGFLSEALLDIPPIVFFIDALDDNFDAAPDAWLDCQHGLFRCIFSLLSKPDNISNRLHVLSTLREVVFSSLLNSEHASRYLTDSHVAYITWDDSAACEFLRRKLDKAIQQGKIKPLAQGGQSLTSSWLGFNEVENVAAEMREEVVEYIVRHTRLLPRDIVIMGNAIEEGRLDRISRGLPMTNGKLRQIVSNVARQLARETVYLSGTEYISSFDYMAETLSYEELDSLANSDRERVHRVVEEVKTNLADRIEELIRSVGKQFFTSDELDTALKTNGFIPEGRWSSGADFFSISNILYRHGLILYQVSEAGKPKWRACWKDLPVNDPAVLPREALLFRFHPFLSDLVPALMPHGNRRAE